MRMDHPITLDQLPIGGAASIRSLDMDGTRRRRMMDLGFVPGASVSALHAGPWGDPVAYGIRGAVIALRKEDAAGIHITERNISHG